MGVRRIVDPFPFSLTLSFMVVFSVVTVSRTFSGGPYIGIGSYYTYAMLCAYAVSAESQQVDRSTLPPEATYFFVNIIYSGRLVKNVVILSFHWNFHWL